MELRALVLGATGLTGRHVVPEVRRRGIACVAHVRPDSDRLERWRERFGALDAELDTTPWEASAIREMVARRVPTHVFALLGTTRARAARVARAGGDASRETYAIVDVGMTLMALRACEARAPKPRFVYLSSIGAGAGARGAYLEARTQVERELAQSGVPYTIARPSFIVGERDVPRASEKIGSLVADAALGLLGVLGAKRTRDRYASMTGAALAGALVRLALDPAWENRIADAADLR